MLSRTNKLACLSCLNGKEMEPNLETMCSESVYSSGLTMSEHVLERFSLFSSLSLSHSLSLSFFLSHSLYIYLFPLSLSIFFFFFFFLFFLYVFLSFLPLFFYISRPVSQPKEKISACASLKVGKNIIITRLPFLAGTPGFARVLGQCTER